MSDAPSWKPHPGNGQAVSTVNTCESAIKIVMANEPKWLSFGKQAPAKMATWARARSQRCRLVDKAPTGRQQVPNLTVLRKRNVETPYTSCRRFGVGKWARRETLRSVCGLGMSEEAKAVL